MNDKYWSGRAFTSLVSLVSFILLCLTGIILFVEPHGRVAYWTKWSFWGLEKDQWGNIHIYSGLLFLIAGGFHIYYNWKLLIKYLSGKVETSLRHKRELALSGLILLWIAVSGIWWNRLRVSVRLPAFVLQHPRRCYPAHRASPRQFPAATERRSTRGSRWLLL